MLSKFTMTVRYEAGHCYQETWERQPTLWCPNCGQKGGLYEECGPGDYYVGNQSICCWCFHHGHFITGMSPESSFEHLQRQHMLRAARGACIGTEADFGEMSPLPHNERYLANVAREAEQERRRKESQGIECDLRFKIDAEIATALANFYGSSLVGPLYVKIGSGIDPDDIHDRSKK